MKRCGTSRHPSVSCPLPRSSASQGQPRASLGDAARYGRPHGYLEQPRQSLHHQICIRTLAFVQNSTHLLNIFAHRNALIFQQSAFPDSIYRYLVSRMTVCTRVYAYYAMLFPLWLLGFVLVSVYDYKHLLLYDVWESHYITQST